MNLYRENTICGENTERSKSKIKKDNPSIIDNLHKTKDMGKTV